jgi:hypothetical protein
VSDSLLPQITLESTVASTAVTEALVAVGFGVLGLVSLIFSLLFLSCSGPSAAFAPAEPVPRQPDRVADVRLCRRVLVFSATSALVIGDRSEVSVIADLPLRAWRCSSPSP